MESTTRQIPEVPPQKEVADTLDEKKQRWHDFLTKISPRVEVLVPTQQLLDELEICLKKSFDVVPDSMLNQVTITDWPPLAKVAFIVRVDTAMPGQEPVFRLNNYSLFEYKDIAYSLSLHYFTQDDDSVERANCYFVYKRDAYDAGALEWNFRASMIIHTVTQLQNKIPEPPQ